MDRRKFCSETERKYGMVLPGKWSDSARDDAAAFTGETVGGMVISSNYPTTCTVIPILVLLPKRILRTQPSRADRATVTDVIEFIENT